MRRHLLCLVGVGLTERGHGMVEVVLRTEIGGDRRRLTGTSMASSQRPATQLPPRAEFVERHRLDDRGAFLILEHVYIRQLQDQKGSAIVESMTLDELGTWGELCGWALARGHARTGQPATIAAYLGTENDFDHAMAAFGEAYADQTERITPH